MSRYEVQDDGMMLPSINGDYVYYFDHKAALAARDAVIRELVGWGDYDLAVIEASGSDWNAMRAKALALIGSEQGTNQEPPLDAS